MTFTRRTRLVAVALGAITLGGAAAATLTAYPAASAGVVSLATTVSCSVTGSNWCISGNNTSSGIGVIGTSKSGTGLRGTSTSQYGLKATSVSNIAILAQTTTGSTAISGTAGSGYGVSGTSTTGKAGVLGSSPDNIGVYGDATSTSSIYSKGVDGYSYDGYGVYGYAPGSKGYGIQGSGGAIGVVGNSLNGIGVEALSNSTTQPALSVTNYTGGDGMDVTAQESTCPFASACSAVRANSNNGYAFLGGAGNGGVPLVLYNSDTAKFVFSVSNAGDVYYSGSLYNVAPFASGAMVRSFGAETAIPVVEDFGTAQLTAGAATVALDATFAGSIDPRAGYRVFLTPDGDTHGLYIASRTPTRFVVRETGGGHATLSFDYRIVATKLGQSAQRMAVINRATLPHFKMPASAVSPKGVNK